MGGNRSEVIRVAIRDILNNELYSREHSPVETDELERQKVEPINEVKNNIFGTSVEI
jgi:Arc/MetJ-type ribon-helix-helix transcriptional regulator